ncbi:MAG: DUF2461 domain-containing protein [Kofleriaceae bacterium]
MAAVRTSPATFGGFAPAAMGFWHELAHEMNRAWYVANKARYQALWEQPMAALLAVVRARLAPAYAPAELGAPKVLRIHRDVRFSKDKTPYKTHIGGVITVAGKVLGDGGTAALYVHVGLDEEFVGVGRYGFDAAQLARWRKAVAGRPGEALAAVIAKLERGGYQVRGRDDLVKVPRGFAPDHPRGDLLRMRGLTAMFPEMPAGLLHQPALAAWLTRHAKATAPLVTWLHREVG